VQLQKCSRNSFTQTNWIISTASKPTQKQIKVIVRPQIRAIAQIPKVFVCQTHKENPEIELRPKKKYVEKPKTKYIEKKPKRKYVEKRKASEPEKLTE
jgi:hypothetical protein